MMQIGTVLIGLPDKRPNNEHIARITENRFNLMKKHGFNTYSEEDWQFFKKWYQNFYPNRKYYE